MTKTVFSKKTDYELFTIANQICLDAEQLDDLKRNSDRYCIVDYNGYTLATANSLDKAIANINKVHGWGASAVVDEKTGAHWNFDYKTFGAGHQIVNHLWRY